MTNLIVNKLLRPVAENWQRKLPTLASVLLLALIAHSAASLTWNIVSPGATIASAPGGSLETANPVAGNQDYVRALKQQQLFGRAAVVQEISIVDAPETQLNLVLRGILAGESDDVSRAIISNGSEENSYRIGQSISPGITVHSILADRVIISRRGTLETVRLPRESGNTGASEGSNISQLQGTTDPVVIDDSPPSATNSVAALTEIVRPIPVSRDGKQIGFRVYPGRARKKFVELGLQAGDIVTAINNITLDDPSVGVQAFEDLSEESSVTVNLIRDGQEQQLVLQTGN